MKPLDRRLDLERSALADLRRHGRGADARKLGTARRSAASAAAPQMHTGRAKSPASAVPTHATRDVFWKIKMERAKGFEPSTLTLAT